MKGTVELPAIAIFTIVAGSLIIAFFVMASQQQSSAGKANIEQASLERFDALLKSAATARETENNITIIDDTLLYICDSSGTRIEYESHIQKPLYNMLLFAPHRLEGGHLLVYSKGVDVPYRMGNILYIATDRYSIYNNTDLHGFPKNFELTNSPGAERVVVAYPPMAIASNVVAVDEEVGEVFGEVYYYNTNPPTKVTYPNHELLHGAVLSADAQTYNCMLTQYLRQLHFVNNIEWLRARDLHNDASPVCQPKYRLEAFQTIAQVTLKTGDQFVVDDARQLVQAQRQLAFMNDELLRGDNCAIIY